MLTAPSANKRPLMDVIFNCPKCEQELAVDSTGAGSEIECPSCGESIIIPELQANGPRGGIPTLPPEPGGNPVNPISTSAAAKVELHLRVPTNKSAESLIAKPLVPLEVAAKETDKKIRSKTIRHTDCIEVGHDKFDEVVTNFLTKVGEANIISITPINYTNLDIGSQKLMTEYGVFVVYRG
jgi:DNA-directed RNA polymerase subunit RPC12/RpoP